VFSPIGFKSVAIIQSEFQRVSFDKVAPPFGSKETSELSREEQEAFAIFEWNRWAKSIEGLFRFLNKAPLYLCLPSGGVLEVHNAILAREPASSNVGFAGLWLLNQKRWMVDTKSTRTWMDDASTRLEKLKEKSRLKKSSGLNTEKEDLKIGRLRPTVSRVSFLWKASVLSKVQR
jgi:hypothetical protein